MSWWKTLQESARERLAQARRALDPDTRRREQEEREALHREVEALLERGRPPEG